MKVTVKKRNWAFADRGLSDVLAFKKHNLYLRYGVVANIIASHHSIFVFGIDAIARGSIPRVGIYYVSLILFHHQGEHSITITYSQ